MYEKSVTTCRGTIVVPELLLCMSLRKLTKKLLTHLAECLFVRKSNASTELRDIAAKYSNIGALRFFAPLSP